MISVEYLKDESQYMGQCEKVITVTCSHDIENALKSTEFITVQGSRTGIAGAAVPEKGSVLSFSSYTGITGMTWKDGIYYLKMKAGTTLAELEEVLRTKRFDTGAWDEDSLEALNHFRKEKNWFFPPDPTEKTATIGGLLATNAGGPLSYYYGRTKDYVEGIKIWLADGSCHEIGRGDCICSDCGEWKVSDEHCICCIPVSQKESPSVMQSYTGKDLIDLVAASEGMIGIVEEVTVRLVKMPENCWSLIFYFKEERDSLKFQDILLKDYKNRWENCYLASIDYLDENALKLVNWNKNYNSTLKKLADFPPQVSAAVYIDLHGSEEEQVEEALYEILELFAEYGEEEDTWAASNYEEAQKFRILRHGVPESVNAKVAELKQEVPELRKLALDLFLPTDSIEKSVTWLRGEIEKEMRDETFFYTIFGHCAEGIYHINFVPGNCQEYETARRLMMSLCKESMLRGGYVCAENGVGKTKKELFSIGLTAQQKKSMEDVKKGFDPQGRFNPGNMI